MNTADRNNRPISLSLHPDALYDEPYFSQELCTAGYQRLDFSGALEIVAVDGGVELRSANARLRITSQLDCGLRIQAVPGGGEISTSVTEALGLIHVKGDSAPFTWSLEGHGFKFETPFLSLSLDISTGALSISDRKRGVLLQSVRGGLRFDPEPGEYSGSRMLAEFTFENEDVFGFGGRIMPPRRNNTSIDVFTVKVGLRSGDYGGCPVPFFLSTKGYGFFLNNPWPHVYFDMGKTNGDEWFCHAPGGQCDIFIFAGPTFGDIMRQYTNLTGRSPFPERWWLGFWTSSLSDFSTSQEVIAAAKRLRDEKYPCEALVIDGPWRGGPDFIKNYREGREYISKDFDWHEEFGDGREMIRELNAMGYRVILHVNSRNFSPQSTAEGVALGLLRKHGNEVVVRLGNATAEAHYDRLLAPRIDDGVELWWTDHADRVSGELSCGVPSRNLFGALWNRLVFQIMRRHGKENRPCLTRGSGIGGQRWGMPWPGDTRVGIDAFGEDIWFCINAGLGGFALTSVDLAGFSLRSDDYDSYPDDNARLEEALNDENICRRLCQSIVLVPVPRIHNNWSTVPKFPWRCSDGARKLYKETLEFRYSLIPYFYHWAVQASLTGEPILRPMAYHHPCDSACVDCDDQLYIGDRIIAAPVFAAGASRRKVYLPEGRWTDWWTGQTYEGSRAVEVETPLEELSGLPLFVKCGAVIPLQEGSQSLGADVPKNLRLSVFPGGDSCLRLQEGMDESTEIEFSSTDRMGTLTVTNWTRQDRGISLRLPENWTTEAGLLERVTLRPGEARKLVLVRRG